MNDKAMTLEEKRWRGRAVAEESEAVTVGKEEEEQEEDEEQGAGESKQHKSAQTARTLRKKIVTEKDRGEK